MSTFRVGGAYTVFEYAGTPLVFCQIMRDRGPEPVAQPEEVQPMDARHPVEIAFPVAHGVGEITLTLLERWTEAVWEQLGMGRNGNPINSLFAGASDIIDVFERNINQGAVQCKKIITPPQSSGPPRGEVYQGSVVTNIADEETVQINTMTLPKEITLQYTHKRRI